MNIIICVLLAVLIIISAAALIAQLKAKQGKSKDMALLNQKIDITAKQTDEALRNVSIQMQALTEKNYEQMLKINESLSINAEKQSQKIGEAITGMQQSNEKKLDEMRNTVNEKLDETLNRRISSSFKTVSEQLTLVYQSLGEMKTLSAGVTDNVKDLNRVLTNVKARGTWAEVQLGNILDETIPGMYETNVQTNPAYNGRVEFAVKIPNAQTDDIAYLPIDSKFPMEDYIRLCTASEQGNQAATETARKDLERRIKDEAKQIKQYVSSPATTPFAIMYLATEGLYAEIASGKSALVEQLQSQGIMIAGPSTITALLNSLAMGFRTMAINKKATEVWKILGAAKTQYNKFGDLLAKARKKVEDAGKALDEADHRNNIIQKNLRNVEQLESTSANDILGLEE
ncbi:MAG: DNA recombination protein RmuC [Anaerotruncus sp.]|nr:DNA recombination protein RmuC [Anaerotruncus sp.]